MPDILERPVPAGDGDSDRVAAEAEFLAYGIDVSSRQVSLGGFERFLQAHQERLLSEWERMLS